MPALFCPEESPPGQIQTNLANVRGDDENDALRSVSTF